MDLIQLFITACVPVFNMLLVTGVGSFLATDFAGILSKEARKHLNNVVFYVFNPSFVSIYLAKTITMESLAKLWFMPVNILLAFTFGLFFGWIVVKVTRAPAKLRGLILGCCSAGNLGNIFLIVIPALCKEKGSPFGAPDVCQDIGLAYFSLSMAIGAVFVWSIAYNIIRVTSKVEEGGGGHGNAQTNEPDVLSSGSGRGTVAEEKNSSTSNDCAHECTLPLLSNRIPAAKNKEPKLGRARKFLSSVCETVDLKKLFAPSTIAVIVGFIIGGTPLIRNAIIGDSAPLRVLQESTELIGGGAIPSVTLIMGANLLNGVRSGARVPPSVIAGVVAVRYILLPLLGTALVKGAVRLGLIQPDPLYQFILHLQYAVPPAMNIGTIMQLFGVGESECSVIFVWVYALASVAVTVWSAFFMWTLS
ncbi:protein PIN-LIKES 3 [Zea mays]|uniref:Protein PIN-LIKES 3 n=1 Tax=Zea mays TaxID=4577 RepID=A0A1D6I789_MAIZE|nr:protein PIN-LIKES 3 [Zea mays]ONM55931.1 Protein PIN-LIKES 3 [Zea mays]|eukprot:XP_008652869.2 protein PIN-LIKES 3 [Zea mays]